MLCCAINPSNHNFIVTGGQDNHSYYFNFASPEQKREFTDHQVLSFSYNDSKESVCAVAFNTSGELCATADMNGVIKIWRTKNGTLLTQLDGPGEIEWLKFHPKVLLLNSPKSIE